MGRFGRIGIVLPLALIAWFIWCVVSLGLILYGALQGPGKDPDPNDLEGFD